MLPPWQCRLTQQSLPAPTVRLQGFWNLSIRFSLSRRGGPYDELLGLGRSLRQAP